MHGQFTDALPSDGKDGIGDGRGNTRHTWFADASGLLAVLHDVNLNLWRFVDAQHRIVVKITLPHAPVLIGEFVEPCGRQPENYAALRLRFDDAGIYILPAVNCTNHAMHSDFPIGIY